MAGPRRWLRTFVPTAAFYTSFGAACVLFNLALFIPLWVLVRILPAARAVPEWVARQHFRLVLAMMAALGAWRLAETRGLDAVDLDRPAVYVANHRTLMDVMILLSLIPRSSCLLKGARKPPAGQGGVARSFMPRLWKLFIVGPYTMAGFVAMPDTADWDAMMDTFRRCEEHLAQGRSLVIFPEGTRSADGHLRPFIDFPFKLAQAADVPVVPVALHTDAPILAKGSNRVVTPRRVAFRLSFLPPLEAKPGDRAGDLGYQVRRQLLSELGRMDREHGEGISAGS